MAEQKKKKKRKQMIVIMWPKYFILLLEYILNICEKEKYLLSQYIFFWQKQKNFKVLSYCPKQLVSK